MLWEQRKAQAHQPNHPEAQIHPGSQQQHQGAIFSLHLLASLPQHWFCSWVGFITQMPLGGTTTFLILSHYFNNTAKYAPKIKFHWPAWAYLVHSQTNYSGQGDRTHWVAYARHDSPQELDMGSLLPTHRERRKLQSGQEGGGAFR